MIDLFHKQGMAMIITLYIHNAILLYNYEINISIETVGGNMTRTFLKIVQ